MKKLSVPVGILVFGGAGVLCLWFGYAFIELEHPVEKWGVFGDKFGALNCLFTGLAMVGVVAALWHEREQAEGRDREHAELLKTLREQAQAVRYAARIHELRARISSCESKIAQLPRTRSGYVEGFAADRLTKLHGEIRELQSALDRELEIPRSQKSD